MLKATNNKLDITLTKSKSIFNGLICKEPVNEKLIHDLINSNLLKQKSNRFNAKKHSTEKIQLEKYRKIIKDGYAYVLYTKTKYGRCLARDALSFLNIRRQIRHTMSCDTMVDVDIVCCHHILMVQMLKKYGFNCPYLKSYVNNRKYWLSLVCKHWYIDVKCNNNIKEMNDIAKNLFIRLLYQGTHKKWIIDNDLNILIEPPNELTLFIDEIKNIGEIFMFKNPSLIDDIIKEKIKKGKVDKDNKPINVVGSLCSMVMLEKENMILEIMYSYLVFTKRIVNDIVSLCADGIMISKDVYSDQILLELTGEIYSKSGFIVTLCEKAMNQEYNNIDKHIITNDIFKPNDDFKVVDGIINRMKNLKDIYDKSIYYDEKLVVDNMEGNMIYLSCNHSTYCKLCKKTHVKGLLQLMINEKDNCFICCHGTTKMIKKSLKGRDVEREIHMDAMNNRIDNFFKLDTSGITVYTEDSKYLGCDICNNYIYNAKHDKPIIILNSMMGKGKSSYIKKSLFSDHKLDTKKSMLFISNRKTFTNFICDEFKEYKVVNYQDVSNGNYDHDRLCIQVESLWKIDDKQYDIVIIDEVETVLNQYSSSTMKYVRKCWSTLVDVIKTCSKCIVADAFILQRSIDFILNVCEHREIIMIHNTKPYLEGRKAIQISQDKYDDLLIEKLQNGKRIVGVSCSRENLLSLHHKVMVACPDKIIKSYDKDSDKSDLKNVDKVWTKCDFVNYTPVIQTGISYMMLAFNMCFANLKSSNLARDAMQMLMRCRVLTDNVVYFSINKRQIYNTSNINMFDTFDMFEENYNEKVDIMIEKLSNDMIKNKHLIDMLCNSLRTSDKILLKTMWHNMREYVLSQCHYNSLCVHMLKLQGYDVILLNKDDHNKDMMKEEFFDDYLDDYKNIKDIEISELNTLKHKNNICKNDRLRIDRYYFENMLVENIDLDTRSKLFYEYYQVSHKKKLFDNIKYENSKITIDELVNKDYCKSDTLVNKMNMTGCQLDYVRQINKILGLNHSCIDKIVIDKTKIVGPLKEFIMKNLKDICCIFNSKIKMTGDNKNDNFNSLKIVQKIYNSWSGLQLKGYECHSRTKIFTSYITKCYDYYDMIKSHGNKHTYDYTCEDYE